MATRTTPQTRQTRRPRRSRAQGTFALGALDRGAIRTMAGAGRLFRDFARAGAIGGAIEAAVGGVEGVFAVVDGHTVVAASRHVMRKAAGGFVVGTTASAAAAVCGAVIGAGIPAFFGGIVGGVAASKLVGRFLGPSPIEGKPKR